MSATTRCSVEIRCSMSDGKARDLRIDVLKGIGILCVIWAHLDGYFTKEIYIFHMPLFFFLSGMFYRQKEGFLWAKCKSLLVPFVGYNLLFSIAFLIEGRLAPFGRISIWFPSAIDGTTWFLLALFDICTLYWLLDRLIGNKTWLFAATVCIGLVFYYWEVELPFDLRQALYALPFFGAGAYFKRKGWTEPIASRYLLASFAVLFVAASVYCRQNDFRFDVLCGYLPGNAVLFYGGALSAILLLMSVKFFSKPVAVNRLMASVGRNSLAIMALHAPYLFYVRRMVWRWHVFADAGQNVVFTTIVTFLIVAVGSYLLALAISRLKQCCKNWLIR